MERIRQRLWAHLRCRAAAYLVLCAALLPTVLASWWVQAHLRNRDEARFHVRATNTAAMVQSALDRYTANLLAVSGLLEANPAVTPQEWDTFVNKLDFPNRHPGVSSIGFAQKVTADQLARFVKSMRSGTASDFEIVPRSSAPMMFPTVLVRQFPTNLDVRIGWDVYSEALKRPALDAVLETRQPFVTPKLAQWISGAPTVDGFTTFLPVQTEKGELRGVVFSAFIPQYFLNTLSNSLREEKISVEMFSKAEMGAASLLASSGLIRPSPAALHVELPIRLMERPFVLRVRALPSTAEFTNANLPKLVLAGGLGFTFLIFGIAWSQGNTRAASENLNLRLRKSEEQLLAANAELHSKISKAHLTEEMLAYERDLLDTLLEHSPDSIYFKNLESRFIRCGRAVLKHLTIDSSSAAVGRSDFDFFAEEHARPAYEMEQEIIRTGRPVIGHVEKEIWLDGRVSWALTSKMPLRDKSGKIIGTFGITKDISALKSIEHALQEEKELLGVTLRSIGDAVITTNLEGRIVLFNKVAERLTGWSQPEAVGRPLEDVIRLAPLVNDENPDADTQEAKPGHDCLLIARGGSEKSISQSFAPIIDVTGNMMGSVLVFRDITEKLRTEAELLKASKIESIGVLAGGIAHDFNNILTVILGNIALARQGGDNGRTIHQALSEAERASVRARSLTQRLLTFAKGGAPIKKALTIVPLVQECAARALHSTGVTPDFYLGENLWPAVVDESQIEQVLHNLFSYVRATHSTQPRLDIHVVNHEIESDPTLVLNPGRYVVVSIRDYGMGLEPEQLSKIFEPCFSPKRNGRGLELASAYSIVRKHDGQIQVESIPGEGTMFHVYLPAALERPAAPVQTCPASISPCRILVMDDELPLRELAALVLAKLGHQVETVADGTEAIQSYQAALQSGKPFDAVIMDLTIPNGMGGQEAIGELLQIDPNIRAIVCSGYSNDPVMANFRDYGFSGIVPKPYTLDDLARAVDELLASAPAAG